MKIALIFAMKAEAQPLIETLRLERKEYGIGHFPTLELSENLEHASRNLSKKTVAVLEYLHTHGISAS